MTPLSTGAWKGLNELLVWLFWGVFFPPRFVASMFIDLTSHRYEECKEKLVPFLKKVGFNPKKDIHFMPCSGLTGANLKELVSDCPWYT